MENENRKEKALEELFDAYMHKGTFNNTGFCPVYNNCSLCGEVLTFGKDCADITDKTMKRKVRTVLKQEGYID